MGAANPASASWQVVLFPTSSQVEEFLDQVALWNSVEGLPTIEIGRLPEGDRLLLRSMARRPENILRLIEAFGGYVHG